MVTCRATSTLNSVRTEYEVKKDKINGNARKSIFIIATIMKPVITFLIPGTEGLSE